MGTHNTMHNVVEDHEALIYHTTYPCAYYVHSPSTLSHANSANNQNDAESAFHSPNRSDTTYHPNPAHEDATRFALSRYSSSRGSTHSFLHQKKISYDGSHGTATENGDINRLIIVDGKKHHDVEEDEEEDDDELYDFYGNRKGGWKRYFTYHKNDSCLWIWLQISWRVLLSLLVALLLFYIVTKPPSPKVQIEISKIREFKLAEGVDRTGVTTKILTCNCSLNLVIENKSKFFGLHIRPPLTDMSFGILPFAFSHGPKLYAESGYTVFSLHVGTKDKVMYGAGRSMQDMLDSEGGLPIVIRVSVSSSFIVVPNLIKPKFHHQAHCLVLLHKAYDKKHRTQVFKSSCRVTS